MTTDNVIQSEFDKFCLQCFGDISGQQYIDLRRTFFGGAAAILQHTFERLSPGDEPSEEDLELIRSINREFAAFGEAVKAGLK